MVELYSIPGSCSTGIHILLEKMQQEVKVTHRDDVPDYRQIVPTNQVPAIRMDDKVMWEGANIVLYLLNKFDQQQKDQPEFNQWLMFCYASVHPAYSKLFSVNRQMPEGEQKDRLMQSLGDRVSELWSIADKQLQDKKYMLGDEPSIVDYLLTVYLRWGNVFPDVNIEVGENVLRMVEGALKLPEVQAVLTKESIEYQFPNSIQKNRG